MAVVDHMPLRLLLHLYPQEKDIGQKLALFYEAYASFLELRRAHSNARAVYQDGIAR